MATDSGYITRLARAVGQDGRDGDPDPYPNLSWLRSAAPITEVPGPGGVGMAWFVTSYALARACLADPRLSLYPHGAVAQPLSVVAQPLGVVAQPLGVPGAHAVPAPHFLATDPPLHTTQRQSVAAPFTPRAVERLRGPVTRMCHELIDAFAGRGRADVLADYALPIPERVTYDLFGIPEGGRLAEGRATELSVVSAVREQPDGGPHTGELLDYLRGIVAYKRRHPGDDLTGRLLSTLAEPDVVYAMYLLFATGHLSTGPFIGAAIARLLQQPERYAALRADPDLCRGAVNEALRYDSAVQSALPRYARENLRIGDVDVAAGEMVLVSLAAANRDPEQYPEPDRFQPDRAAQSHLAFGHGIHFCLGAPLARMEGEVALRVLVSRLPDLRLDVAPERIAWALGPLLRSPREVPVAFDSVL